LPVTSPLGRELPVTATTPGGHVPLNNTVFPPGVSASSCLLFQFPSSNLLTEPVPPPSRQEPFKGPRSPADEEPNPEEAGSNGLLRTSRY